MNENNDFKKHIFKYHLIQISICTYPRWLPSLYQQQVFLPEGNDNKKVMNEWSNHWALGAPIPNTARGILMYPLHFQMLYQQKSFWISSPNTSHTKLYAVKLVEKKCLISHLYFSLLQLSRFWTNWAFWRWTLTPSRQMINWRCKYW